MKNLLLLSALFCTIASFSQLTVKPNGTQNSYVYVNDQVLYVTQDLNLTENNTTVPVSDTIKASVYLRNQAQLIQGNTTPSNRGTGYISVIQNSNSDAYDYNYWASPVGTNFGGPGNENFGILRVYDSLGLVKSAQTQVTNAHNGSSSPLNISLRWLYRYPAGAPNFIKVNTANAIAPGYGFTMKGTDVTSGVPNTPETQKQKYDFRGKANSGNISVAVINNKYTLSGNPYPSSLDLNRVFFDPDNSEIQNFQYWDEDRSVNSHLHTANKGGYGTWIPGTTDPNGIPNPPSAGYQAGMYTVPMFLNYDQAGNPSGGSTGNGTYVERRFAPIGQGFMLFGQGTGNIIFKDSHRRYIKEGLANDSEFRNSTPTSLAETAVLDTRLPQLRINAYMGESHMRQILLAFSDEATFHYDRGLDALSPMDATSEVFFPVAMGQDTTNRPFVIQTVPFDMFSILPITFSLDRQTKIGLTAIEEIKFPADNAYIYDNVENTYKKFTGNKTAVYNLPAGNYKDRFYIVFKEGNKEAQNNTNEQRNQILSNVDFFQNNIAKQLEVGNPEGYNIKSANIFSMTGQLVISEKNLGNNTRLSFPTGNLSDGVYLVMLTTDEDITIDYKIIVNNKK
jgi:hypothetical protein